MFDVFAALAAGDRVKVHIPNDAPIGPDTEHDSFDIEAVEPARVRGTDPNWGTDEVLVVENGDLLFRGTGKQGPVERVERLETDAEGRSIVGSGEVLFVRGEAA